jgi:hypothetical protein
LPTDYKKIYAKLAHLIDVSTVPIGLPFTFSTIFNEMFMTDLPNYKLDDGSKGATRRNWTYHTACSIAQTCRIVVLTWKCEAALKRDAVVETKEPTPEIALIVEWKWKS